MNKTKDQLRLNSVSNIWIDQIKEDASYFSSASFIKKSFFENILASRWIISLLKDKSYKTFLDAGCYIGRFGISLAAAGKKVTLMDCSEQSLKDALTLKKFAAEYYDKLDLDFACDDLEQMHFRDGEFDVTFNEGVLEHWLVKADRIKIIREMARVTRSGGMVSIKVINSKNFLNNLVITLTSRSAPSHHRYNLPELKDEMKQAGLVVIDFDGDTMNDPARWVKSRWSLSFLYGASFLINHLPKFLREILCPSIFCSGLVQENKF